MLSVLAVGPASATGFGKWEPIKKDKFICVKWVKVIKHDGKKFVAKHPKFLWVKKSEFLGWKGIKKWDFKKDDFDFKYKFLWVKKVNGKKVEGKKKCIKLNPKKWWKGKKPPVVTPPNGVLIEDCLVHFNSSAAVENGNYYNIITGFGGGHANHEDDDENRLGTDFNLAELDPEDEEDAALLEYLEDLDEADDGILTCDEIDDLAETPNAEDEALVNLILAAGDENEDNVGTYPGPVTEGAAP